jgi:hypothetical protein
MLRSWYAIVFEAAESPVTPASLGQQTPHPEATRLSQDRRSCGHLDTADQGREKEASMEMGTGWGLVLPGRQGAESRG